MQMPLLLTHEADFHLRDVRCVREVLAVVIAPYDLRLESERRDRAAQLVDVVRSDGF
jgi:hypothetical protein